MHVDMQTGREESDEGEGGEESGWDTILSTLKMSALHPLLCQMLALWDKVGGRIGQCCTCPTVKATQVVVQCGVMETHQFKPSPCP